MEKYEMGVILRADMEEDNFRAEMEKVKNLIDRFGGTIEKVDEWGRRKLAYPIQKLTEGMYTFITYTSKGETPREVENRLNLQESVLRYLTINRTDDEAQLAVAPAKAQAKPAEAEPVAETVEPEPAEA
jgi:small subunit ribosomal protein S6